MFRIVVTKFPRCRISGRYRITSHKFHKTTRNHAKDKADLCPPEPGKGGSTGTIYTIGALAVITGGTFAYAKYDPDFRHMVTDQAPFMDPVFKFVFQEEGSGVLTLFTSIKTYFSELFQSSDEPQPVMRKREEIIESKKEYKPPKPAFSEVAKHSKGSEEAYTEIRLETKTKDSAEPKVEIVGVPRHEEASISKIHPRNIAELEARIGETAARTMKGYNKALVAVKRYNQEIEEFIEDPNSQQNQTLWNSLKKLTQEKNTTLMEADKLSKEVNSQMKELEKHLNDPHLDAPLAIKEQSKSNIHRLMEDINKSKKELERENKEALLVDKYWHKVQDGRKQFTDELEILFPNINVSQKKLNIDEGDLDLFVLHAVSKVLYYQKELAKMETVAAERLKMAVENAKRNGAEILSQEQICQELEKQKRLLEEEYEKKCLKLRMETERDLRQQLKLQSEAFQDHLNDAIKTREMEIEQTYGRNFDEKLMTERTKFKEQVAAMVGRLRGMDQAMRARDDAEKVAQQAQVLWSACQALYRSIRSSCPGLSWMDQLRPLKTEIIAVQKAAAENDELVKVVLDGIPKEAINRGVYPEDALRERFLKVEKVARSLALVPEEGARLHTYLFSYLQSLLLLTAISPIPAAELNDEKVNLKNLGTNDILQRARYYLDRGDFAQTLKYMNLLKGASRAVARQWMDETRILLETQQAANTLMAHASASGLMYL